MKLGNYEFELKGFKFFEAGSQETYCFAGTLYINGKKAAECENNGHGGSHNIYFYPEHRTLENEITEFLKTVPKIKSEHFPDMEFDFDMEHLINELVEEILNAREQKKLMNKTKKYLLFQDANDKGYFTIGWPKRTVEEVLKLPGGHESVKKAIAEQVAEGHTLMNQNIPSELLPAKK